MSIDPWTEDLLSLSQAARRLPRLRAGRPVSPSTIWRWAAHGIRGIKLETIPVGGRTCTSAQALRRFFKALAGQPEMALPKPDDKDDEAVERELAARGYSC
jgi:hypothetical protein